MSRVLVLLLIVLGTVCGDVVIINSSPTGRPGDIINIQGEVFASGSSVQLTSSWYGNASIPLKVVNEGNGMVQAQIPSNILMDKYSLVLTTGGSSSKPFYLNKATVLHTESMHVCNKTSFRIFGRNLYMGATPLVLLQSQAGVNLSCQVDVATSNQFVLNVTTPATLQSDILYTIFISNNLGGVQWSPLVNSTYGIVGCASSGIDAYGLNVPWAGYFKDHKKNSKQISPSGTLKDSNLIQDAINQISSTNQAGEVVLAPGDYGLVSGISIPSNVVLRGSGSGSTKIFYNHVVNTMPAGAGWVYFTDSGANKGIADLAFINAGVYAINGVSNPLQVGPGVSRAFLKGLNWNMNITSHAFFNAITESAITDSTFILSSTPTQNGNFYCSYSNYAHFKNNVVTYDTWGLHFLSSTNVVIENNVIHRNAGNQIPDFVTHGFAVSFTSNLYFANNFVDVVNGRLFNNNDGETLLSEGGGRGRGDIGGAQVTSATSTTLQDTTQNWAQFTTNPHVAITSGPGNGQHRRIISNTATTLTIEYPWTVVPTSASTYSFGPVAANWTVYKNHFLDQERGVWMFMSYMYSVAIHSNILENSDGICIIAYTTSFEAPDFLPIATWMYDIQITNNSLSWNPTTTYPRATYIGINHDQVRQEPLGVIVIGTEIKYNSIKYLGGGTRAEYSDEYGTYDGYQAKVTNQGSSRTQFPLSVLGTIFQNNSISSFYSGLVLGEFVAQTVVAFPEVQSCTVAYRNVTITRADEPSATDTNRATVMTNYYVTTPQVPATSSSSTSALASGTLSSSSLPSTSGTSPSSSTASTTSSPSVTSSGATSSPVPSSAISICGNIFGRLATGLGLLLCLYLYN